MTSSLHRGSSWLLLIATIFIAGCAINTRARGEFDPNNSQWQGRLALQVDSTPRQAFTANFDLQGSAQAGSLTFATPLGTLLARLQWDAHTAVLQARGETRHFDSLDALTRDATGTELPIASLFAWLHGDARPTPGWEVDLQALPTGRLTARKLGPEAPAELKIILDH